MSINKNLGDLDLFCYTQFRGAMMISRRKIGILKFAALGPAVFGFLLLTLVFSLNVHAAPETNSPDENETHVDEQSEAEDTHVLETVDVTQPKESSIKQQHQASRYFYRYNRSFSPHVGYQKSFNPDGNENDVLGFHYMFASGDSANHWELSLQLVTGGFGQFFACWKHVFNPTDRLRPFVRIGPGGHISPDQFLATFLYSKNWLATAGGGFEYVMKDPMSLRLELNAQSDLNVAASYNILAGWSWGF